MRWSRIETMGRSVDLSKAVQARIADPLWMIGRQWQLGELVGDDAAQPAAVHTRLGIAPLVAYRNGDGSSPLPVGVPLERLVETSPAPLGQIAALHVSVADGQRLMDRLSDERQSRAADRLRASFQPVAPDGDVPELGAADAAAVALLSRHGVDGARLRTVPISEIEDELQDLSDRQFTASMSVILSWRNEQTVADSDAWQPDRLEYEFSVAATSTEGPVFLRAPEHQGGTLDWHSFDVDTELGATMPAAADLAGLPQPTTTSATTIASPVRFSGMPASRWWEFEDGPVHLGDIDVGPGDLGRLAVAEFGAVYGDDWFVIPARVARSSLTRVESLTVFNTFGLDPVTVKPASVNDDVALDGQRPWRYFELSGDRHLETGDAPWLVIPPALSTTLTGPDVERVAFARDEDANLAWAVERLIEGPFSRAIDRAAGWTGPASAPPDNEPRRYDAMYWRYELEASPPPWWIPMIPERYDPDSEQVRLRRARLATWEGQPRSEVGPKGELLEPSRPYWLREEELPRSGATASRSWVWTRWEDGSAHTWRQRRKRNGRGERSSGLEWDALRSEFD